MKKLILSILTALICFSCSGGDGGGSAPQAVDNDIRGIVRVSGNAFVDFDPKNITIPVNNSSIDAQYIGSESETGGYLRGISDNSDWFIFNGARNETISFIGENGLNISAGKDPSSMESFSDSYTLQGSGNYYLRVYTGSILNQGNYKISIKSSPRKLSSEMDFVPGEVIIKLRDDGLRRISSSAPVMDEGLELKKRFKDFDLYKISSRRINSGVSDLKQETIDLIERLKQNSNIEIAEPNFIRKISYAPNDYYFRTGSLWNLELVNIPYSWDMAVGEGVIIAVLDTGIVSHEEFPQGKIVSQYDFVDGDNNPFDQGDEHDGIKYHGLHVAGIAGAKADNSTGIAGAAPEAKIMPLRVVGEKTASSDAIAAAINYASGFSNSSRAIPQQRADIINMSFGGPGFSEIENRAIENAASRGVILVASAGNDGKSNTYYPAGYDNVIAVSAVDRYKDLASYSNFGSWITLSAPGGDNNGGIIAPSGKDGPDGYYQWLAGTSMAAPLASGVFALMKSVNNSLDSRDLLSLIYAGKITDDLGAPGFDDFYGYGLINAKKAVLEMKSYFSFRGIDVYLKDDAGNILEKAKALKNSDGSFSFRFSKRESGNYKIQVGSDLNNDFDFSDLGELTGAEKSFEYNGSGVNLGEISISIQ